MALKKPTIAKIVRVIELPFGVKNVSVDLRCSYETLKGNDSDISDNTDLYLPLNHTFTELVLA